ncbi:MAG: sulfatase-like hydrolase/transferase [Caldilineaceae bacterium]
MGGALLRQPRTAHAQPGSSRCRGDPFHQRVYTQPCLLARPHCLLTGRTPSQVGIHDWLQEAIPEIGNRDWLAHEITLPELLTEQGYHCGLSGKWHMGQSHRTPRGFAWSFGLPGWQGRHNDPYTYHLNGEPLALDGNKSTHITDYALRFLEDAPTDRPFFLNVGYIATHSPYEAETHDPALVDRYADATFADIPPYHPHPWHRNEGMLGGLDVTEAQIRSRYRGYYAAVSEIDREVGRILDFLESRGQLDNTIVIYTSDHGCALGHQGFWGKGNSTRPLNMYEVSLRVPLLMRWPGQINAGQIVENCVDHYDTFQTICRWTGVDLSSRADRAYPGSSFATLTKTGTNPLWEDVRFGEYGDLRMIRTPQHKFVRRYPYGPYDLFDLVADPNETLNRAGWPEYAEIQDELSALLKGWYADHQDPDHTGMRVKYLPRHNENAEAWRDGKRERRGLQVY